MTNIERIKQMNAEEMAEEAGTYFEKEVGEYTYPCKFCVARKNCNFSKPCKLAFKDWLEQEVEEDEHNK